MPSPAAAQRPVLGAVLSQFPRYDEAFILRELVALARGEGELLIFSLRPCRDRVIHDQAKALQPRTVYAPFLWSAALWRSHAHFLRCRPGAYLGCLGWIVSRHWDHPVILMKTLALFPKTVHFARIAQQRGVTHLHAFWATYPAASAMVMSRLMGAPYSLSGHAHDIHTRNPTLVEKMRGARFVLTCTEANRDYLLSLENGRPACAAEPSPIIVSYHGVDLSQFQHQPKPDGPPCRILAVGSLLPCKGYETLLDACRRLKDRAVPFRCTIAGGGPLEPQLRRLIAHYELAQQLELLGYVSQETVVGLYQRAHLCVLPLVSKIHWGIPNVLIEALATKTPVISCQLPSMQELIEHGRTGWIIPEADAGALAKAIETLWADPLRRREIADAGYARVRERFSIERTGQALRALFASAPARAAIRGPA